MPPVRYWPMKRLENSNATRMSVAAASWMAANLYFLSLLGKKMQPNLPTQMKATVFLKTVASFFIYG